MFEKVKLAADNSVDMRDDNWSSQFQNAYIPALPMDAGVVWPH